MDNFDDIPLAVEDGEPVLASIAHWYETPPRKGGLSIPACTYGVNLVVGGRFVRLLWAAGYGPEPTPIISHALSRVLKIVPPSSPLTVETIADFGRYWGPEGIVANRLSGRTIAPRELALWPLMKTLQAAHGAGRWHFAPLPKKPTEWSFLKAKEVAIIHAKKMALRHKAEFKPTPRTYPRGIAFLQGGTV